MVTINRDDLVTTSVQGIIGPPQLDRSAFRVGADGEPVMMIGMAGIVYNVRVGDPAFGWEADHVEPCVSLRHPDEQAFHALRMLSCVGNRATVMTGQAAGVKGVVTGQHGHILVDFPPESLSLLCPGDVVKIDACGHGLRIREFPSVVIKNTGPELLDRMGLGTAEGRLTVPVVAEVPPYLMGSGVEIPSELADVDLMSADRDLITKLGLDGLRLGDIVALPDQDHSFGRGYYRGAMAIGLVTHGDSAMPGHGPGIVTLFSSRTSVIIPVHSRNANIAHLLSIG